MKCIGLRVDGHIDTVYIEASDLHTFFKNDAYTFCTNLPHMNAVGLARKAPQASDSLNYFSKNFPEVFEETHGDILLVGSDEHGNEYDLDLDAFKFAFVRS